ncbi:hypothetical protein P171DRAFT_500175 [Karstenula rhodostoma CBS 690.94]|uniref:Uncharacterized protein n=1 Tax=Karstenula rhodostoma CBS 690.94 TaxID=1392251 RepID=A0A9P4PB47_9PLEO|nr:hypothetical protein P171DRAFT_500175 [Karstenula rhodostoma CBS 690.94]
MADHLNLAAACISVIGFPHWDNQPLALLTLVAGALPGKWFNPVRIGRKAQNLTSGLLPLFHAEGNSLGPFNQSITFDFSNPGSTNSPAGSKSSHESSHGVTFDEKTSSNPPYQQDTIYVSVSAENKTTTSSTPTSSSHLPPSQNSTAVESDTTMDNGTLPKVNVSSWTPPSPHNSDSAVDNDIIGIDKIINNGMPTNNKIPTNSNTTAENDTSTWLAGLSSWYKKWFPDINHSSTDRVPSPNDSASNTSSSVSHTSKTSSGLPSDVSPAINNDTAPTPQLPPAFAYGMEQTIPVVPLLVISLSMSVVLNMFLFHFLRLYKNALVDPQPVSPAPLDLQPSIITTIETLPLNPQPIDPSSVELKQTTVTTRIEIVPLDPPSVDLEHSAITSVEVIPLDPPLIDLQPSAITTIETVPLDPEPIYLPPTELQQSTITTSIDIVPLDTPSVELQPSVITAIETLPLGPSYTDTQAQTEPVIPTLGFSSVSGVFVDPIPIALQQSAITTIINTAPVVPSYTDMEVQTLPTALPYTDVGVQIEPVIPSLTFSSIEQVSVDPVPVALQQSAITTVIDTVPMPPSYSDSETQTDPIHHSYTDAEAQTSSLLPSHTDVGAQVEPVISTLSFSGIEQVSVHPIPVKLEQSNVATYTDMEAQTEPVLLSFSEIREVSSLPTEMFPVIHVCSGCKTASSEHRCSGCHTAPEQTDSECQTDPVKGSDSGTQTEPSEQRSSSAQTDFVELKDSNCQKDSVEVEHTNSGCQTDPIEVEHIDSGVQTDSAEVEQRGSSCQTDSTKIKHTDSRFQTGSVQNKQEESVAQGDSDAQMESVEPTDLSASTIPEQLVYKPFPNGSVQSIYQQRSVNDLDNIAWPYGPTSPAPEGWQTREDFTYPPTSPPKKPDPNDPNLKGKKGVGNLYRNKKRNWQNLERFRVNDAQIDYDEYVLGPGPASSSVERMNLLFRPEPKHMTEEERAKKESESTRLSQTEKRRREYARNQQLAKAQGEQGEQGNPPNFHLDRGNPRHFEALGLILPIRLPSASEDVRRTPQGTVTLAPPAKVNAASIGEVPPMEGEQHQAGAQPRIRVPPTAGDTRNPGPPKENILVNPPQKKNTGANVPNPEKPEEE